MKIEQGTLDLDAASSRCPPLSPFYQAPAVHGLAAQTSASQLPGLLSHLRTGWPRLRQRGVPGTTGRGSTGATPGPLISIRGWGWSRLDPPCCTALGKVPHLPGVPKGLHKLIVGKPQAEGRSLSRPGLYGQLSKPQPPQLQRPRRMTLAFWRWILPDFVPTLALSGHATLASPESRAWHTGHSPHI